MTRNECVAEILDSIKRCFQWKRNDSGVYVFSSSAGVVDGILAILCRYDAERPSVADLCAAIKRAGEAERCDSSQIRVSLRSDEGGTLMRWSVANEHPRLSWSKGENAIAKIDAYVASLKPKPTEPTTLADLEARVRRLEIEREERERK